jgi:transcription termination/antitermination protein NusG
MPLQLQPDSLSASINLSWYALYVKPRHEKVIAAALSTKGYETYLPLYRHRPTRLSDPILPLFPGYVFCRFDPVRKLPVVSVPGVFSILGRGQTPTPVDADELLAVREIVQSGRATRPWPYLVIGQAVYLERGPLAGLEGTLVKEAGADWLVVSITLLQRSVATHVERDAIRPVVSAGRGRRQNLESTACGRY